MKETIKTSRTVGYLEKMYRQLNQDFFGGELETPIITIQSTPRAYGHVTCSRIWRRKDTACYELNIGAESLARPIENVVSTLLHEMVHIYHLMNGIQDCSRGNTYHNKKFKAKAESVGLHIEYDTRIGWSITSPTEELIDYIIAQGWSDIQINRGGVPKPDLDGSGTEGTTGTRKPSSTRKYMCPKCGISCRATKDIRILCVTCAQEMQKCS